MKHPVLRNLLTLLAALLIYYVFPVGELPSDLSLVLSVLGLAVGGTALAVLIVGQARREIRAEGADETRLESLLVLIYLTVLVFAITYFAIADASSSQFVGLETKTDSLYFTMTTLSTVGMGDIYPSGQLARALVSVQIVFNLVFVALLVHTFTNRFQRGRRHAAAHPDDTR